MWPPKKQNPWETPTEGSAIFPHPFLFFLPLHCHFQRLSLPRAPYLPSFYYYYFMFSFLFLSFFSFPHHFPYLVVSVATVSGMTSAPFSAPLPSHFSIFFLLSTTLPKHCPDTHFRCLFHPFFFPIFPLPSFFFSIFQKAINLHCRWQATTSRQPLPFFSHSIIIFLNLILIVIVVGEIWIIELIWNWSFVK